jgi:hypothetical protein
MFQKNTLQFNYAIQLMTAEADFFGKCHSDSGIGAHSIHALDDILNNRFDLRIRGKFQHFIVCYIIFLSFIFFIIAFLHPCIIASLYCFLNA